MKKILENIFEKICEGIYHQLVGGFHIHKYTHTPGQARRVREIYKREKMDVVFEDCVRCEKQRQRITRIWKK